MCDTLNPILTSSFSFHPFLCAIQPNHKLFRVVTKKINAFQITTNNHQLNTEAPVVSANASHLTTQAKPPLPKTPSTTSTNVVTPTNNNNINPTTTADAGTEPSDDLHEIISDYERRLQEQVALARQDVLRELEVQIQVSGGVAWFIKIILRESAATPTFVGCKVAFKLAWNIACMMHVCMSVFNPFHLKSFHDHQNSMKSDFLRKAETDVADIF